jgi:hypothetical protein
VSGKKVTAAVVVGTRRGLIEPASPQVASRRAVLAYGFAVALEGSGLRRLRGRHGSARFADLTAAR